MSFSASPLFLSFSLGNVLSAFGFPAQKRSFNYFGEIGADPHRIIVRNWDKNGIPNWCGDTIWNKFGQSDRDLPTPHLGGERSGNFHTGCYYIDTYTRVFASPRLTLTFPRGFGGRGATRRAQLFLSSVDLASLEAVKCDEVALDLVENTSASRSGIECRLVIQLTQLESLHCARCPARYWP